MTVDTGESTQALSSEEQALHRRAQRATVHFWSFQLTVGFIAALVSSKDGPTPTSITFFGLIVSQLGILSAMCAFAPDPLPMRLAALMVGAFLLTLELSLGIGEPEPWVYMTGGGSVALCFVALSVWRAITGARFTIGNSAHRTGEALQFGIRHLCYLTFAVALVSSRWEMLFVDPARGELPVLFRACLALAVVAVVCAWAMLGHRATKLRVLLALIICIGVGFIQVSYIGNIFSFILWVHAACTLVSLAYLRLKGFRLVRVS